MTDKPENPNAFSDREQKMYKLLRAACNGLRSYQFGNAAPDFAKDIADTIDEFCNEISADAMLSERRQGDKG